MKTILATMLLCFSISLLQAQESQLEKLSMLSGTWMFSPENFSATADIPPPPATRVSCGRVTESNGLYCTISAMNEEGNFELTQSELMVYDQSTDKIYMLLFDGPSAYRAEGRFEGNTLSYADSDMAGVKLLDGSITFEDNKLIQQIRIGDDNPVILSITFLRQN